MDALRLPPPDAEIAKSVWRRAAAIALCRDGCFCVLTAFPLDVRADQSPRQCRIGCVARALRYRIPGTVLSPTIAFSMTWPSDSGADRGRGYPFKGNYSSWPEQKSARLALEENPRALGSASRSKSLEQVRFHRARQAGRARRAGRLRRASSEQSRQGLDPTETHSARPTLKEQHRGERAAQRLSGIACSSTSDFRSPRSGIVGITGPNGAGKTTLFRMLVGEEKPDGTSKSARPSRLRTSTSRVPRSSRTTACGKRSPHGQEKIPLGKREIASRAYCSWFDLKGSDQQKKLRNHVGW